MKTYNATKISNWLLWEPLKFAFLAFILIFLSVTIHTVLLDNIFSPITSQTIFIILTSVAFIYSLMFLTKRLSITKMDRQSFVSLHIAQTFIYSLCFYLMAYLVIYNFQTIMFNLMVMESQSISLFVISMVLFSISTLYISGVYFSNLYAKIRRIQDFKIPTWKIICSIPFGFSALWVPGFLLEATGKQSITVKNKRYNKIISWVLSSNINTISTFVFITLLSTLFFGLTPILLTFVYALVYGIWVLQIGTKKFKQKLTGTYANYAVIANIVLLATIIIFSLFAPTANEAITININDTNTITQTIQGQ